MILIGSVAPFLRAGQMMTNIRVWTDYTLRAVQLTCTQVQDGMVKYISPIIGSSNIGTQFDFSSLGGFKAISLGTVNGISGIRVGGVYRGGKFGAPVKEMFGVPKGYRLTGVFVVVVGDKVAGLKFKYSQFPQYSD